NMTRLSVRLLLLTLVVGLGAARPARADIMTPAGLNPGDQFRIIFVSSGTRDATSSNIGDYDTFIGSAATAARLTYNGVDVPWVALGSPPTVSANDSGRLPVDASAPPIYRLDGVKVADNTSDLWDGTIDAPINVNELGTGGVDELVFTGTAPGGGT